MQPEVVFVGVEALHGGGGGKRRKPGVSGGGQERGLLADRGRETAAEPRFGEQEADGLEAAQAFGVQSSPCTPKRVVLRMFVEEAGDFVHVEGARIAVEHVLQQMERRVGDGVLRREYGQLESGDRAADAAGPELVDAPGGQALKARIPELKMKFDGERHVGVEEVAAPLPTGGTHQGGEVVGGEGLKSGDGKIARREQGLVRGADRFARAVEIDVGLRTVFGADAEKVALRDAFERDEVYRETGELAVGILERPQAEQVVGCVPGRSFGQDVADQESDAGVVAKVERGEAVPVSETGECFGTRFGEVQGGKRGGGAGGQARTVQPWVRQFRIVPHCC
ncbi:MAG: hypothetical protein JWP63_1947 [Candidatus Solibacter sp.]|nr:hypothetical protein [Candidatus Solibacter sp.]